MVCDIQMRFIAIGRGPQDSIKNSHPLFTQIRICTFYRTRNDCNIGVMSCGIDVSCYANMMGTGWTGAGWTNVVITGMTNLTPTQRTINCGMGMTWYIQSISLKRARYFARFTINGVWCGFEHDLSPWIGSSGKTTKREVWYNTEGPLSQGTCEAIIQEERIKNQKKIWEEL